MAPFETMSAGASAYTLLKMLNSGSFGDVYLAEDASGNYVAVKILYGDDRESIEDELRFCRVLDHPSIIKTYDVLEVGEQRWVVSEFCENGDLFGAILPMEGVGDEARIKRYMSELVDAVAYMHNLGVVHRDIKPENVLLTASDDVKLCDFGLSKYEHEEWEEGVGTVAYMAPEVYQLPLHTTVTNPKATDIWSLGCTLYTMVVGMLPWEAPCLQDPEYEAFRENMGRFEHPDWSEDLHELLWGMLHWDPAKRFTIAEVQRRVRESADRPWILAPTTSRVLNRGLSFGAKLDEEVRRPRSPPGARGSDFIVFRDENEASEMSDNNWTASMDRFTDPRRLLPPPRRPRYDSGNYEIEFNPYLQTDSPLLLVSRAPSLRSSSSEEEDDVEEGGSWFAAGAMSFSSLPKFFDDAGENRATHSTSTSPAPVPANITTTAPAVMGTTPPRFVLGGDDGDDEDEEEMDESEWEYVRNKGVDGDGEEEDDEDQGIGRSLTEEYSPGVLRRRASSSASNGNNSKSRVRWGDLADMDREMSFSVLPQFDSLTIAPEPSSSSSSSADADADAPEHDSSEDSGVERDSGDMRKPSPTPRSRPIAVPSRRMSSRSRAVVY